MTLSFQDQGDGVIDPATLQERMWLRQARDGDLGAFNALVELYQRQVYNLAYRTLGNSDDAADASQEAFLSAYRSLESFRGGSFRAWLLRIVVNACYDRLRRRKRQPAESLDSLFTASGDSVLSHHVAVGPEFAAMGRETAERIQAGLLGLGEDQRVVLVLADVQGLNYEEISIVLDISLGTVKSRLSRARAKLREYLLAHGELPGGF